MFVHTAREEFDYPSGDQNKYSTYQGTGGFPVGSFLLKAAAAISQGEPNIVFTGYLTGQSRMMIYRKVEARLAHLAGFLHWDQDPYLVITDDGRLVWMVDGYTTSLSHPYSATLPVAGLDEGANYIRNAVKATVDAYTGKISLYVFDPSDPIIQAYENVVPETIPARFRNARRPAPACPLSGGSFSHPGRGLPHLSYARSAGVLQQGRHLGDRAQPVRPVGTARADAAHLCRGHFAGRERTRVPADPAFHPARQRQSDRVDGRPLRRRQLGDLVYFQLSKQQLMYGPMQIESRIDQDQNISKDLTLWNQQGSHVLRGNIIALPVTGGFLYVESIYIQATEARMPQLKKVVLAMGDRLIYRDTFDQALAELTSGPAPAAPALAAGASAAAPAVTGQGSPALAERLRRLHDQAAQLTRELEALEKDAQKK